MKSILTRILFLTLIGCLMLIGFPQVSPAQQLELVVQTGHSKDVSSIIFSHNDELLVSISDDKTAKLWHLASGLLLHEFVSQKGFDFAIFSPDDRKLFVKEEGGVTKVWDVYKGKEIQSFGSEILDVEKTASLSPDGKFLATGDCAGNLIIRNVETGKEEKRFKDDEGCINEIKYSFDGRKLINSNHKKNKETGKFESISIAIREVENNFAKKLLNEYPDLPNEIVFTSENNILVANFIFRTEDRIEGEKLKNTFEKINGEVTAKVFYKQDEKDSSIRLKFSQTGAALLNEDKITVYKSWETTEANRIITFQPDKTNDPEDENDEIDDFFLSSNNKYLATVNERTIEIFDVKTGAKTKTLPGYTEPIVAMSISDDFKRLATETFVTGNTKLWSLAENKISIRDLITFKDCGSTHSSAIAISPDFKILARNCTAKKTIRLLNLETGEERQFKSTDSMMSGNSLVFSPDAKLLASSGFSGNVVWNVTTGEVLKDFANSSEGSVVFSRDGKMMAFGGWSSGITIWDLAKEKEYLYIDPFVYEGETFKLGITVEGEIMASNFTFNPQNNLIAGRGSNNEVRVWSLPDTKLVWNLKGHNSQLLFVAFSKNGNILASGDREGIIKLWDVTSGKEIRTLNGHLNSVRSLVFSDDDKKLISASFDGTIRIWDVANGKELASLIAIDKVDWVVIDPEGRFDASDGALKLMHYSYGLQTINLEEFKDEYYEPGLLQKVFKGEPLRAVASLKDTKLPPEIIDQKIAPNSTMLNLKLKNRGGGFGEIRVFVNDKLAVADARDANLKANPNTTQEFVNLTVDLKDSAFVRGKICEVQTKPETCHDNQINVVTSNYLAQFKKSNMTSRGSVRVWLIDDDKNYELPTLYAIIGGVSDYTGNTLDLKFAAKDAEDFSNALRLGATRMLCPDKKAECLNKIDITTLSTSGNPGTILPTKENFKKTFARVAHQAKPEDIVIVYLSGHGVSFEGEDKTKDTYFYLTQDASSGSKEDLLKNYRTVSISSDELLCWLSPLQCEADKQLEFEGKTQLGTKALKQIVILDTCAAGKAGTTLALTAQKELTTDQRRAIEFLKDKSGTHILMGSTADAPSYEASRFGQGLLTYSLLVGMRGGALQKPSNFVDVRTLFDYAEKQVPMLAKDIGGIQRPTIASPTGKTFVIGHMTDVETANISLPQPKPYVLRPSFGNKELRNRDNLKINERLAQILDDESRPQTKGNQSVLVYLHEDSFPGAIQPTGFYLVQTNGNVRVELSFWQDDREILVLKEFAAPPDKIVEVMLKKIREALQQIKS